MTWLFWLSVAAVVYAYVGYPVTLAALARARGRRAVPAPPAREPSVTIIIPVYNEATRVAAKVANTAALDYPPDRLQVLFVSDGSNDATVDIIRSTMSPGMDVVELPRRGGKAAALNAGLSRATHDILVFSDASIQLQTDALRALVGPFADATIGCVSGEDRIAEAGGEGLYGRYELWLRRLESEVHSIVGASGSFYAQRRSLCQPFTEGMAPDFLSVLRTVEQRHRAVSELSAVGSMTSVKDPRDEFERKVRTLIRGLTTLFAYAHLLNPVRFGWFAFLLFSHKVMRWLVPFFMVTALLSNAVLARTSAFYLTAFAAQVALYAVAVLAYGGRGGIHRTLIGKIALYFTSSNLAVLVAWLKYGRGVRQELWTPSRR